MAGVPLPSCRYFLVTRRSGHSADFLRFFSMNPLIAASSSSSHSAAFSSAHAFSYQRTAPAYRSSLSSPLVSPILRCSLVLTYSDSPIAIQLRNSFTRLSRCYRCKALHPATSCGKLLEFPAVRFVGRISYSLYLWQELFLNYYVHPPSGSLRSHNSLCWAASILCALASYYLIETPMIRFGHRLTKRLVRNPQALA
jgi:hypothetical protein